MHIFWDFRGRGSGFLKIRETKRDGKDHLDLKCLLSIVTITDT